MEIFTREKYQTREEWHKLRGKGIGGSDAGAILGLSNFKTNTELYREKIDPNFIPKEEENEFTEYGKNVEDPVRKIFTSDYVNSLKVYTTDEVLVRKDKPYIRASVDGEIEVLQDVSITPYFSKRVGEKTDVPCPVKLKKGMRGIYEGKSAYISNMFASEEWHNKVPEKYFAQVVHYLITTGYDFAVLSALITFPNKFHEIRNYIWLRENVVNDIKYLEDEEDKFWNENVLKKVEPSFKLIF